MSGSNTIIDLAADGANADIREALTGRANLLDATQVAEDAILSPRDPGGLSHSLRAALAARIARLHECDDVAMHFWKKITDISEKEAADPKFDGGGDTRLAAILRFTDLVSAHTRDADGTEITALKSADVTDADIVRLAELNAFIAYQIRVIEGLRLMAATR